MRQSKLFIKTLKEAPKDATSISHKLLVRAGYISQLSSGIWTFLPIGFMVLKKIENIIRNEMNNIGGQELLMPALQPKELWETSGRWKDFVPPLFKTKDRHQKELALGPTHEEVVTDLIKKIIYSYKQLPFSLYQIQNKFRNEMRSNGGLLRTREFLMKDLYSFHANVNDLEVYYKKVLNAYSKIYVKCGLKVVVVKSPSGSMGGSESHEFMVLCDSGEDKIIICQKCKKGFNLEISKNLEQCEFCGNKLTIQNCIEAGHIFKLGDKYSKVFSAKFVDKEGKKKDIITGCYGIGLGRLMATVVEVFNDKSGIIWPKTLTPYKVHLLNLSSKKNNKLCEKIYRTCHQNKIEVLYDDRNVSQPIKLKDSDLIGISLRLVVSDKTFGKIEYKERGKKKCNLINNTGVINTIKKYYNV